jgi:hypothetical protein
MELRSLTEAFAFRRILSYAQGKLYGNKRDFYKALGYPKVLTAELLRAEFERNAVANRVVKALPVATWRGGGEVIEDQNPETVTAFEQAFIDLDMRLNVWDKLRRTDVLAGIGRYAVLYIGASGKPEDPLERVSNPKDIQYIMPFGEDDAKIASFENEPTNPRFAMPTYYNLTRSMIDRTGMSRVAELSACTTRASCTSATACWTTTSTASRVCSACSTV